MRMILLMIFLFCLQELPAQKPAVDVEATRNWPVVSDGQISSDGKFVFYTLSVFFRLPGEAIISVVKETNGAWKKEITGVQNAVFSQDSKRIFFLKAPDSLCVLNLIGKKLETIGRVVFFKLFQCGDTEYLLYQLENLNKELVLQNLENGQRKRLSKNTGTYAVSDDGKHIFWESTAKNTAGESTQYLKQYNLLSGTEQRIWAGQGAENIVFNTRDKQVAFLVKRVEAGSPPSCSIWVRRQDNAAAELLIDKIKIDSRLSLYGIERFSRDGKMLFLQLRPVNEKPHPASNEPDVWSYMDYKLNSDQETEQGAFAYTAVLNLDTKKVFQIDQENYQSILVPNVDNFVFINKAKGYSGESNWNIFLEPSVTIRPVESEKEKKIPISLGNSIPAASPDGKFMVGVDLAGANFFSFNTTTEASANITEQFPRSIVTEKEEDDPLVVAVGLQLADAWLQNNEAIFMYDKYDIWAVDPSGKKLPVNVTNGYGRKHNISFRFAEPGKYNSGRYVGKKDELLLSAFNKTTKENGFYLVKLGQPADPTLLTMGPYVYYIPGFAGEELQHARHSNVYLVKRESASAAPNYFTTRDFREFTPVSDNYPEKKYTWLNTELITWNGLDGRNLQSVIYKPETFDPHQKYPAIIHYYEKMSDRLNRYLVPQLAADHIDIPWFVSRGYIVVTPDIYYTLGEPANSAFNSIEGFAGYLSGLPFIDSLHMGLQGHSFGGFETNAVISKTNRFAAAGSAAGPCNLVSEYGNRWDEAFGRQPHYETGQGRIGASLWERPDLYIRNSPLFAADRIKTPLLIMHNKKDGGTPFEQGIELFSALYNHGKVWMLQYDQQGHTLFDIKAQIDYTIRLTQFFDHYLKGAPAPPWMKMSIPATEKTFKDGLSVE